LGHVHGDKLVDLPICSVIRQRISSGSLRDVENDNNNSNKSGYSIYRESGWIALYPNDVQDLSTLIQDFKSQYERIRFA
jgi:hypothetical protein